MIKKNLGLLIFALFASVSIFAQQTSTSPLPRGYSDIQLGLTVDEVKDLLKKNSIFGFRGDRDVSLLPTQERVLIETAGSSFFSRCWFQFYEDKLYAITLNVNTKRMDYYSMFTRFCEKYGKPATLNPSKAEWEDDGIILSLEKPLTVKYIDSKVYNELIDSGEKLKSSESVIREEFLNTF
ncbi:MAG: hypothetical protein K6G52_00285 [Treponemataceae bacterium]|nr:hypothetical protein [Treponemataceae bacterium]